MEPFAPHSDDEQASGAHGELELGNVVVEVGPERITYGMLCRAERPGSKTLPALHAQESREPTPAPELQQLQQQDSAPQRIKPLILFDLNGMYDNAIGL